MKAIFLLAIGVAALSPAAWAQHQHPMMHNLSPAKLTVTREADRHLLIAKLGPLNLPAHTDHMAMAQAAPQWLEIPFDGWITAYHPSLVDDAGNPLPGRMLHHVAFWNTARSDFLCPNKEEHIFGAGGEMNDWPALPGFGYRVHQGDRIRVTTMFHNPTGSSHSSAWLVVRMEYQPESARLKSVYPAWFDVKQCGDSSFPIRPTGMTIRGELRVNYGGRLLGVGGHLHDYGEELVLTNETRKQPVATLRATQDDQGHIRSVPVALFLDRGGYAFTKGETVEVEARYGKPRVPNADGMGIVVGYFLPDNDADMKELARGSGAKSEVGGKK